MMVRRPQDTSTQLLIAQNDRVRRLSRDATSFANVASERVASIMCRQRARIGTLNTWQDRPSPTIRARVLLADDHAAMLKAVGYIVGEHFDVIGRVSDGQAAVEAARALRPDVVVLDISMPVLSGLGAAMRILSTAHPPRVIMLTMRDDQVTRDTARELGTYALISKTRLTTDLLPAIHAATSNTTSDHWMVSH